MNANCFNAFLWMIGMCVSWLFAFKETKMNIAFVRPFVQLKMAFTRSQKDVRLAFLDNGGRDEKRLAKIFAIRMTIKMKWEIVHAVPNSRMPNDDCSALKSNQKYLLSGNWVPLLCVHVDGYNWIKTDYYAIFRMLITFLSFLSKSEFVSVTVCVCVWLCSAFHFHWPIKLNMRYLK